MIDIVYIDQYMSPLEIPALDLVGRVESALGRPIARLKLSNVERLGTRLWDPNKLVWFSRLIPKEAWETITAGVDAKSINVMFASTRLGEPVMDPLIQEVPDFHNDVDNYCLEYNDNLATASYESWGILPSCIVANPLFDWGFSGDSAAKDVFKRDILSWCLRNPENTTAKLAVVCVDYLSSPDVLKYGQYFPYDGSWGVVYYTPFCESNELKPTCVGTQLGRDIDFYKLLTVADAVITDKFYGPEYFATSINPAQRVIMTRGPYVLESASEASASYFKSAVKFFARSVVQVEADFLDRESLYVQYTKVNQMLKNLADPGRSRFNYISCNPVASTQDEAVDGFIAKVNTILSRVEAKLGRTDQAPVSQ